MPQSADVDPVELAAVSGPGNALGTSVPIAEARHHVFGVCLLTDWSALLDRR